LAASDSGRCNIGQRSEIFREASPMRLSLILGILLVAVGAFMTISWSQRSSVRVQQQILEMRIKAFKNQKTQHSPWSESDLQNQERLEDMQQELDSLKVQSERTK
jgi:hypothetical protein